MFKIVVSDPKTKRTYQKEVAYKESGLLGRKLGDKVKGEFFGLHGYEFQLTGGSDKQGFPMRQDIQGSVRKKILLTGSPGFHPTTKGERRRKLIRGNTLSEEIVQVNMKVVTYGKETLAKLFGKEEPKEAKEARHEEKAEHKEAKHEEKKEEHKTEHGKDVGAEKKYEEAGHEKPPEHERHAEQKSEHAEQKAEQKAEHSHEHKKE